jgi:hypothetical protein
MFLMNEGTGREQCVMTISHSNVLLWLYNEKLYII